MDKQESSKGNETSVRRVVKDYDDRIRVEPAGKKHDLWETLCVITVESNKHITKTYGSLEALWDDIEDHTYKVFREPMGREELREEVREEVREDVETRVRREVKEELAVSHEEKSQSPENELALVDVPKRFTEFKSQLARPLTEGERKAVHHSAYLLDNALSSSIYKVFVKDYDGDSESIYSITFNVDMDDLRGGGMYQ